MNQEGVLDARGDLEDPLDLEMRSLVYFYLLIE